jgi:serine/threonine-protein kinase RsbT
VAPLSVVEARRLAVRSSSDVASARRAARSLAMDLGFGRHEVEEVVLATSELGTNLVRYATAGELRISTVPGQRGHGIEVESADDGPGIADVDLAVTDGFSTGGGLGGGLGAARRLMDTFEIASTPAGTRVVVRKWPTCPS